jgi:hypothetical protein
MLLSLMKKKKNKEMKKILLITIIVLLSVGGFSQKQKTQDEVHLKMGKILVGEIIETKPDEYIIFRPNTKDADKIYIEMKDVEKIVSITVEEKEKSKVKYSNFTSFYTINNIRNEKKTGRIGLDMVNGVYIPFNNDFALDLGIGLGFAGSSVYSTVPVYLSTKINKQINENTAGFIGLDLGFNNVVWASNQSAAKYAGFFSFLGVGVKYKVFNSPLFYTKIGFRYENFESSELKDNGFGYIYNNYIPFSILNLQLNIGVNF